GAFVLGRTLRFQQPERAVPSYHPETAGLLVYNELRLKRSMEDAAILELLLRSRILARLRCEGPTTIGDMVAELGRRSTDLGHNRSLTDAEVEVQRAVTDLVADGAIEIVAQGSDRLLELTSQGDTLVSGQAAAASRFARQFHQSLVDRAGSIDL